LTTFLSDSKQTAAAMIA